MTEKAKILSMVAEGKITAEEAERLLNALNENGNETQAATSTDIVATKKIPDFLNVKVEPKIEGRGDRVSIRIPLKIVKAGMKLGAFLPDHVKDKTQQAFDEKGIGFNLNDLNAKNMDEFLAAMSDFTIDVDSENERVQIYCS